MEEDDARRKLKRKEDNIKKRGVKQQNATKLSNQFKFGVIRFSLIISAQWRRREKQKKKKRKIEEPEAYYFVRCKTAFFLVFFLQSNDDKILIYICIFCSIINFDY